MDCSTHQTIQQMREMHVDATTPALDTSDNWSEFRDHLMQCWLAQAIYNVMERACAAQCVDSGVLLSIGDDEHGSSIRAFVQKYHQQQHVKNKQDQRGHWCNGWAIVCEHQHTPQDVEALQRIGLKLSKNTRTCPLLIIYGPNLATESAQELVEIATHALPQMRSVLLLRDPFGLLNSDVDARSCIQTLNWSESHEKLEYIIRPLQQLHSQCGWRFVLEIATWVAFPKSTQLVSTSSPLFTSASQLPFQLLLLLLRWSHFHPHLLRSFGKYFLRKLQLIPQKRIRQAIKTLATEKSQLWEQLDFRLDDGTDLLKTLLQEQEQRPPLKLELSCATPPGLDLSTTHKVELTSRVSKCRLWDVQKQFYVQQGIKAWSNGIIPFGVSSSSFLAAAYAPHIAPSVDAHAAGTAVDFLRQLTMRSARSCGTPNCYVWEAASGSCKFLHAFLQHFFAILSTEEDNCTDSLPLLAPCVIASDLSDDVLESRMQMACFRPFLEKKQLDFARFDSHDFLHGDMKKQLILKYSNQVWHVGSNGPVFLMGNYFFDSLRTDVFTVTKTTSSISGASPNYNIHEALVSSDTSSIANMHVTLRLIDDLSIEPMYTDAVMNRTLEEVIEQVKASSSLSSLILFPVEAFQFLLALSEMDSLGGDAKQKSAPAKYSVGIVVGDASFSFRDPISSAFITGSQTTGDGCEQSYGSVTGLEIPQLSPHPDCFCLPVDFEILRIFIQQLHRRHFQTTQTSVSASVASDTFDLLYATVMPPEADGLCRLDSSNLHLSFEQEFVHFAPSECDLLWGMMGIDGGAHTLSLETQFALLMQTGWDFDLFVVLQWPLMRRMWEQNKITTNHEAQSRLRGRLVDVGIECRKMYYALEEAHDSSHHYTPPVILLQLARWFYELQAYDQVLVVLEPWRNVISDNVGFVGMLYLLGLTSYHVAEYWKALVFFRKCAAIAPTRLKYQRWIGRTLHGLQAQWA